MQLEINRKSKRKSLCFQETLCPFMNNEYVTYRSRRGWRFQLPRRGRKWLQHCGLSVGIGNRRRLKNCHRCGCCEIGRERAEVKSWEAVQVKKEARLVEEEYWEEVGKVSGKRCLLLRQEVDRLARKVGTWKNAPVGSLYDDLSLHSSLSPYKHRQACTKSINKNNKKNNEKVNEQKVEVSKRLN